ncbi:MAG: cytochrome b/b6 domain-containing protein [Gemmatimonadota bacterium]|nr:MAG: cytochrome b/b6 domain-containing protein [Gemmatimonadota bacterium]
MYFLFLGATPAAAGPDNDCSACHGDSTLTMETEEGVEISLFVDEERFLESVHGPVECGGCHTDVDMETHPGETSGPVDCGLCHDDAQELYAESLHGKALAKKVKDAPTCSGCHGAHYILTEDDEKSKLYPPNIVQMCAKCHADHRHVEQLSTPGPYPTDGYKNGIHFVALTENESFGAAACNDCHGSHTLKSATDPESMINRLKIHKTCGSCHPEEQDAYLEGIHAKAVLAGAADAPTCSDCHGEHVFSKPWETGELLYKGDPSVGDCIWCHSSDRILAKYGLTPGIVESYLDDFHGLAARSGDAKTATCGDCHGLHDIRPHDDPSSSVNKANLPATCGRCHPDVGEKVAVGSIHLLPSPQRDKTIYYLTAVYIILIVCVIGGMLLHNGLDLLKKIIAKFKGIREHEPETLGDKEFVRLTLNERVQHFILFTSFFILVITGFALKFPECWLVAPLLKIPGMFALRGFVHRLAGGIFIILAVYHAFYIAFTKRGREQIVALLPNFQDMRDVVQMFLYLVGLSKERPKYGRYNYAEKAEYWALVWGTFVMGVSGLILWFENAAMKTFPKVIMDVATVVHYYEAILATLAIIVWHFYFVFFDPETFPMKTTCITGRISEEEMIKEHPLEYEVLLKNVQKNERK